MGFLENETALQLELKGVVFTFDAINTGPFKFEVQQHLTELRIPPVVSDNQALFAGGH